MHVRTVSLPFPLNVWGGGGGGGKEGLGHLNVTLL